MSLIYPAIPTHLHLECLATRPRVMSGRACFVRYVIRVGLAIRVALGRNKIAVLRLMKKKMKKKVLISDPTKAKRQKEEKRHIHRRTGQTDRTYEIK
jgi:hypothetical protein